MLIQTSTTKEVVLLQPHFYCPKCHSQRPYEVKPASIDFTFCYIPIFEAKDIDNFIVCQVCKKGFDPLILKPSNKSLFRLVATTRYELMHSSSPGAVKLKLISDGLKEEFINKLIMLALS